MEDVHHYKAKQLINPVVKATCSCIGALNFGFVIFWKLIKRDEPEIVNLLPGVRRVKH